MSMTSAQWLSVAMVNEQRSVMMIDQEQMPKCTPGKSLTKGRFYMQQRLAWCRTRAVVDDGRWTMDGSVVVEVDVDDPPHLL
jgi:hypothetical protein